MALRKTNSVLKIVGYNDYHQLGENSNNKEGNFQIIFPPINSHIDVSTLSSFHLLSEHAVWSTHDGKCYAIGKNNGWKITGALSQSTLTEEAEFPIYDNDGNQCKIISAACGTSYTLYLVMQKNGTQNLAYSLMYSKSPNPLFLSITGHQPVALFGGNTYGASIDTEGAILIVNQSLIKAYLPNTDKCVSVSCCIDFILALSENGKIYMSKLGDEICFSEVDELSEIEIINISGTCKHCFALSFDGRVFVFGSNKNGALGLGSNILETSKFVELTSLRKYKIASAYAGTNHSLFQTEEGKILACGFNECGQLFLNRLDSSEKVFSPVETTIKKDAIFCIAGAYLSAVFIGDKVPPNIPNTRLPMKKNLKKNQNSERKKFFEEENEVNLSSQQEIINDLEKKNQKQLEEIQKLKATINDLKNHSIKEKFDDSTYMNHIRYLENHLSKYEKVQQFDINNPITHRRESDSNSGIKYSKSRDDNRNIFIGNDDEESQRIIKKIGEGATSVAYKIIDTRTSQIMCKKVLKQSDDQNVFKKFQNSIKEIEVLLSIDHPSICKAIGFNSMEKVSPISDLKKDEDEEEEALDYDDFEDNEKTTIAIFLEYLPFKLKDILKSDIINNTLKTKIAIEIAFGMLYIHNIGMIHRDLKIENIMLNYVLEAKIIDFDLVHIDDNDNNDRSLTKGIGTLDYMSPEMLNNEDYTNKTDVYSYGILLFVLFIGHLPKQNMKDKMEKKQIQFPHPSSAISSECIDLIKMCTSFEPENRPSFDQILEFMKSKSFSLAREIDFEIVKNRFDELNFIQSQFNSNQLSQNQLNKPHPPSMEKKTSSKQRSIKIKPSIKKPF